MDDPCFHRARRSALRVLLSPENQGDGITRHPPPGKHELDGVNHGNKQVPVLVQTPTEIPSEVPSDQSREHGKLKEELWDNFIPEEKTRTEDCENSEMNLDKCISGDPLSAEHLLDNPKELPTQLSDNTSHNCELESLLQTSNELPCTKMKENPIAEEQVNANLNMLNRFWEHPPQLQKESGTVLRNPEESSEDIYPPCLEYCHKRKDVRKRSEFLDDEEILKDDILEPAFECSPPTKHSLGSSGGSFCESTGHSDGISPDACNHLDEVFTIEFPLRFTEPMRLEMPCETMFTLGDIMQPSVTPNSTEVCTVTPNSTEVPIVTSDKTSDSNNNGVTIQTPSGRKYNLREYKKPSFGHLRHVGFEDTLTPHKQVKRMKSEPGRRRSKTDLENKGTSHKKDKTEVSPKRRRTISVNMKNYPNMEPPEQKKQRTHQENKISQVVVAELASSGVPQSPVTSISPVTAEPPPSSAQNLSATEALNGHEKSKQDNVKTVQTTGGKKRGRPPGSRNKFTIMLIKELKKIEKKERRLKKKTINRDNNVRKKEKGEIRRPSYMQQGHPDELLTKIEEQSPPTDIEVPPDPPPDLKSFIISTSTFGETTLHRAARLGKPELARYCLEYRMNDVNAKDNAGYTPLHECCVQGNIEIAQLLLSYGADVNASALDGTRPIHDAVMNTKTDITRLLLSYGADPLLKTYSGQSAVTLAYYKKPLKDLLTGYLADVHGTGVPGYAPPQTIRFHGSCLYAPDDSLKKFLAFKDARDHTLGTSCYGELEEDDQKVLISLSDEPHLPTYSIHLTEDKVRYQWLLLGDVLKQVKMRRCKFFSRHPSVPVVRMSLEQFLEQVNVYQISKPPSNLFTYSDYHRGVELIALNKELKSVLHIEEMYL